jgi:hypothetical protein
MILGYRFFYCKLPDNPFFLQTHTIFLLLSIAVIVQKNVLHKNGSRNMHSLLRIFVVVQIRGLVILKYGSGLLG